MCRASTWDRRATSLLADGREYTARVEGLFGALRVDPALGRLYLSAQQRPGQASY